LLRWLVYLAERVEDVPLVLICAGRPGEPGADQALIDVLASAAQVVRPALCRPVQRRCWFDATFPPPSTRSPPPECIVVERAVPRRLVRGRCRRIGAGRRPQG
jgi:hypothetical protein